jgi:hypothetical protein
VLDHDAERGDRSPVTSSPLLRFEELSPRERRRLIAASFARTAVISVVIGVAYFVLPMRPRGADGVVVLLVGLVVVSVMVVVGIRQIVQSPHPGLRAVNALALTAVLFITAFSTTYFVMSDAAPDSYSEALTKLDAAYFTVTAFATVGFGDIVAKSEVARAVVTIQMLSGLILVGLIARVVVGAVQEGRDRQRSGRGEGSGPPAS